MEGTSFLFLCNKIFKENHKTLVPSKSKSTRLSHLKSNFGRQNKASVLFKLSGERIKKVDWDI
jgi:hypothetical protein